MRDLFAATASAAVIGLALGSAVPAFARGGLGGPGGGPFASGSGFPPGFSQGNRTGWNGGSTPPGWSHGTKKGWGTGTMPPGLSRH
jgi:hypothetical protein